jgi:hypothetical protein
MVDEKQTAAKQKIMVFQQNGSGEVKIAGLRQHGGDMFALEIVNIDDALPVVLDDTSAYLPQELSCDLVLDFLQHNDLSTDLASLCSKNGIPVVASGKKVHGKGVFAPPT